MGSFIVRIFLHDGESGTPWQALFWVAMVVCIGLGGFYAFVWMNASGPNEALALKGLMGCAKGLGVILLARALAWFAAKLIEANW